MKVLGLAFVAFIVMGGVAMAQPVPHFAAGLPYTKVRAKLIQSGWRPTTIPGAPGCTFDGCKRFPETMECFGVGAAPCYYSFERGSAYLKIVAEGEGDPQSFARLERCRALVQDPRGPGGWRCDK
jgi:hypothetical protein